MKKYVWTALFVLLSAQASASVQELIDSVKKKDTLGVQTLLAYGENVNETNEQGNTALHYAVAINNAQITQMLLDAGADMNIQNTKGWSPLMIAEKKNIPEVYAILQKAQKKTEIKNSIEEIAIREEAIKEKVQELSPAAVKEQIENKAVEAKEEAKTLVEEVKTEVKDVKNQTTEEIKTVAEETKAKAVEAKTAVEEKKAQTEEKITTVVEDVKTQVEEIKNSEPMKIKTEEVIKVEEISVPTQIEKTVQEIKTVPNAITVANPEPNAPTVANPEPKTVQPVQSKPAEKEKIQNASVFSEDVAIGDEEIIYCLNYLALQGEQPNMTVAAGYFAQESGVSKKRHDAVIDISKRYFENASEENIKRRADECAKIITPSKAAKQNQIIRSLNKSMGY